MSRFPALQDAPFTYYNGAYLPGRYSGIGAWVKYRPGPSEVRVVEKGQGYIHLACPDRELLLTRDSLTVGAARQFYDQGWTEFVPFSWSNSVGGPAEITQYMTNYAPHAIEGVVPARLRAQDCVVRDPRRILADSGGFQIFTGKAHWISPVKLAKWYADNVDEGTTLDIPGGWYAGTDLMDRAAIVQNLNTKVLRKNLPDSFGLFDVIHGQSLQDLVDYHALASKGIKTDRLAIGGVYSGSLLESVRRVVNIVLDKRIRKYQQYHILGVYNLALLCPLIRFAALLRKQGKHMCTLTSDASTNIYSATNRTLHLQRIHRKPMERLNFSRMAALRAENPYRILPCHCMTCQTLKYADVLSHIDSAIVSHIMITHNAVEIDRWVKMMTQYAMTMDAHDYLELATVNLEGSTLKKASLHAIAFVEDIFSLGLAAAEERRTTMFNASMFDVPAEESEGGDEGLFTEAAAPVPTAKPAATPAGEYDAYEQRGLQIIGIYEKYHQTGEEPPAPEKQRDQKRVSSTFISNTGNLGLTPKKKKKKIKKSVDTDPNTKGRHARNRVVKVKHSGGRADAIKLLTHRERIKL